MSPFPYSYPFIAPHSHHYQPSTITSSFSPLFRLLDEFDHYARSTLDPSSLPLLHHHQQQQQQRFHSFTPRFDVKESKDAYELHGELPGMDQKDVEIEFLTDGKTLRIKGRTVRTHETGNKALSSSTSSPATEAASVETVDASVKTVAEPKPHQATVEDDATSSPQTQNEAQDQDRNRNQALSQSSATERDSVGEEQRAEQQQQEQQPSADHERFWISERSVGEFTRSFSFPGDLDTKAATASMKDGVLSIVVPKVKRVAGRRIEIV